MRTIAHVYDSYAEASRVVSSLEAAGVLERDISLISGDKSATGSASGSASGGTTSGDAGQGAATGAGAGATAGTVLGGGAGLLAGLGALVIPGAGPLVAAGWLVAAVTGAGVGAAAGGLLGSLTGAGLSEADARTYSEGVGRGGTLVTVRAEEALAPQVESIMKGGLASGTAQAGTMRTGSMQAGSMQAGQTAGAQALGADESLKIVRENLVVGKREVDSGAARVTTRVVETPVEEQVSLHDETVRVERRPVDQALGTVPADAFQERVIEVRAMGEEAVVQKDVRVVEEIAIRKEVSDRTETVRDTVRETKVEVEGETGTVRPAGTTDAPPRR